MTAKFQTAPSPASELADMIRAAAEAIGPVGTFAIAVALCAVAAAWLART